jgi:hypothetical protein
MAVAGLNLPTDIPWERMCVTTDMLDTSGGLAAGMPPLWQSSLALYRYVPGDEYQLYPGRRIVYLKLTCTITNFQPKDDQLVGLIDPGAFTYGYMLNDDIQRRLAYSLPCTGAVVQVTVSPMEGGRDPESYPYFLDIQPRQRLLYEQATETQERASRSLETLQVRKSAGMSNSLEVLDVDKGGGVNLSIGGSGGGGSRSGEWGAKSMAKQDADQLTTGDASREARETLAFTTQMSQMYTLLQAYHVGTNRVVFLMTPRPHTIEPPTGIAGPRKLDGIQDLFFIVSQDEDDAFPCVTARLDTGHLTVVPQFDYDRSRPSQQLALEIDAPAPVKGDPAAVATGVGSDALYGCIIKTVPKSVSLDAPEGYVVDTVTPTGVTIETGSASFPATSAFDISPDRRTVTLSGTATGYGCYRDTFGEVVNVFTVGPLRHVGLEPVGDAKTIEPGMVRRSFNVSFRSELPTKSVGEQYGLTLTFRQLKCCDDVTVEPPKIVAVVPIPDDVVARRPNTDSRIGGGETVETAAPPDEIVEDIPIPSSGPVENRGLAVAMGASSIEAVNAMQRWMGDEILRLSNQVDDPVAAPALDDAFLVERLVAGAIEDPRRRTLLALPAESAGLTEEEVSSIAEAIGRTGETLSRADILAVPDQLIEEATGRRGTELVHLRLKAAAIPTREPARYGAQKKRSGR